MRVPVGVFVLEVFDASVLAGRTDADSELNLYQNAALVTLDGIEALATVKARVRLAGHTTLVDVTALTGAVVGPGPPARIDIVENAMFPQCEAEALAEALKAPGWMGSQDVRDNLGECP